MPEAEGLNWPQLMRLGLGVLRLTPAAFWEMTPGELRRALEGAGVLPFGAAAPLSREGLEQLMAAFPDKEV
ncbi:MAG: rcc01693 family protein [Pseudomonadota bacterium]